MNEFNGRIKQKIDSYEEWIKVWTNFTPFKGEIIIITNYEGINGKTITRIGDGISKLCDLPNQTDNFHLMNNEIHISNNERNKWNEKVNVSYQSDGQELIFTIG